MNGRATATALVSRNYNSRPKLIEVTSDLILDDCAPDTILVVAQRMLDELTPRIEREALCHRLTLTVEPHLAAGAKPQVPSKR